MVWKEKPLSVEVRKVRTSTELKSMFEPKGIGAPMDVFEPVAVPPLKLDHVTCVFMGNPKNVAAACKMGTVVVFKSQIELAPLLFKKEKPSEKKG